MTQTPETGREEKNRSGRPGAVVGREPSAVNRQQEESGHQPSAVSHQQEGSQQPEDEPGRKPEVRPRHLISGTAPINKPKGSGRLRQWLFGKPRDIHDRGLFHRMALVAFLAWVGVGADGLSSASYGPSEAFIALGEHKFLALALAAATALTVVIISAGYSRIIEAFPSGGGGYQVATEALGPAWGAISGGALIVDYVLTITVSIAAAGNAIFSLLPMPDDGDAAARLATLKIIFEVLAILGLVTLNIRGVKEAIVPLVPVFVIFLVSHAVLLLAALIQTAPELGDTVRDVGEQYTAAKASIGLGGIISLFFLAYSMGAGTYTGIESVSNSLSMMREPRVLTGKRTMVYMAVSLSLTAGGLLVCFLLENVADTPGRTLNAVLAERVSSGWPGVWSDVLIWSTLISSAFLLVVAAQTGFIGGPRVLANMALDSWVPRRFASLSERLTTMNGIILMGGAALAALWYTAGDVSALIVMYSINVFITFTISMVAMVRHTRRKWPIGVKGRRSRLTLFGLGTALCAMILVVTIYEKIGHGAWITIVVTGGIIVLCFMIRKHYQHVRLQVAMLERIVNLPVKKSAAAPPPAAPALLDQTLPTAVILVGGYNGLGIHTALTALASFKGYFKNLMFISAGVIDTGAFKSPQELAAVRDRTEEDMRRYLAVAAHLGVPATYAIAVGIDRVDELEKLCSQIARQYPRVTFFAGRLIFQRDRWYHAVLHNQTAVDLQKRLQWAGIPLLILPIRVR